MTCIFLFFCSSFILYLYKNLNISSVSLFYFFHFFFGYVCIPFLSFDSSSIFCEHSWSLARKFYVSWYFDLLRVFSRFAYPLLLSSLLLYRTTVTLLLKRSFNTMFHEYGCLSLFFLFSASVRPVTSHPFDAFIYLTCVSLIDYRKHTKSPAWLVSCPSLAPTSLSFGALLSRTALPGDRSLICGTPQKCVFLLSNYFTQCPSFLPSVSPSLSPSLWHRRKGGDKSYHVHTPTNKI